MSESINDTATPQDFFLRISGTGEGHWETGRPQPSIIELVQRGIFHGDILDVGCGLGDNAIHIVSQIANVHMTAIDLATQTIDIARKKAQKAHLNIRFDVADILGDPSLINAKPRSFDIVLDAAVFHVFSDDDRQRYITNLEYLLKPNGLYIQLCFSEKETRYGGPRRMKKSVLNELFSLKNGWMIESITDSIYESTDAGPLGLDGRAYLSLIRRCQNF